jgi:hypothetical protein
MKFDVTHMYFLLCMTVALYDGKSCNYHGFTALCWDMPAFSVSWSYTQTVGLLEPGIGPSQGRYLYTGQHKENKRTETSMPQVEFEPTIPVFEWAKTVHALVRAATVIGKTCNYQVYKLVKTLKSTWISNDETAYHVVS